MEKVNFKVFRFDANRDKKPYYDSFEVPFTKQSMTVLEGLFYIQEKLDGSVAFRSSCRAGVCGSCAMYINGKYRLACETQIKFLGGKTVTVEPLGHLKVIRDLVVDMEPFWKKYKYIKPYLIPGCPGGERERIQTIDEREKINKIIDCILCAACYASCTVTETDKDYIGPAALLKANRFIQDSRDRADEERIRLVSGEHGIWRCHTIFSCQYVCPKDLDPSSSIATLKKIAMTKKLKKIQ